MNWNLSKKCGDIVNFDIMCKISFIIPVYNLKQEEVETCISSVVNQTVDRSSFEIIIVDDGSNNGIETYCDIIGNQYGATVIHQPNQGLAVARNTGMRAAHGEWIVHVDGDDWITNDLVETFEKKCGNSKADIVVWGFVVDSGLKKQKLLLKNKTAFDVDYALIRENVLCAIMDYDSTFSSLALNTSWGKAYRRDFITNNNLYYNPSLRRAQDAVYNLYSFYQASNIEYIDKAFNFYRTDNVSLSRSFNPKNYEYLRLTALAVEKFVSEKKVSQKVKDASSVFIQRCFRMINEQYYQHKDNPQSYCERRRLFMSSIKSEPFISAFSTGLTRQSLLHKIIDKMYIRRMFGGIWAFNRLLNFAYRVKNSI